MNDGEKTVRGPYQDLAFMKKYIIQYRTDEIESFEGVIENLNEDYQASLIKKQAVGRELLKTVQEKTKELQQCQEECEEKHAEIEAYLEEKLAANQAIRDQAENDLRVQKELLEETTRTVEERRKELEYWKEYADKGHDELESEIRAVTKKIEGAQRDFQNDKDFINKQWEHYRLFYVKNEKENLDRLKMKYLDSGIDGLSQKQRVVIKEKFRLILELKQQITKIEEQKNECRQQENAAEMYRIHLDKLRRRFYNIVPVPEWIPRMKSANSDTAYITHEEPDLCQHETPFRVPLKVETTWLDYKNFEGEDKKLSKQGSSMIVNTGENCESTSSAWKFDKNRVIRAAHGHL